VFAYAKAGCLKNKWHWTTYNNSRTSENRDSGWHSCFTCKLHTNHNTVPQSITNFPL